MPVWAWVVLGVVIYFGLLLGWVAMCKCGADEDREMERYVRRRERDDDRWAA